MIRFETRKIDRYIAFEVKSNHVRIDEGLFDETEAIDQAKELISTAYDLLPEYHEKKAKALERILDAL